MKLQTEPDLVELIDGEHCLIICGERKRAFFAWPNEGTIALGEINDVAAGDRSIVVRLANGKATTFPCPTAVRNEVEQAAVTLNQCVVDWRG